MLSASAKCRLTALSRTPPLPVAITEHPNQHLSTARENPDKRSGYVPYRFATHRPAQVPASPEESVDPPENIPQLQHPLKSLHCLPALPRFQISIPAHIQHRGIHSRIDHRAIQQINGFSGIAMIELSICALTNGTETNCTRVS